MSSYRDIKPLSASALKFDVNYAVRLDGGRLAEGWLYEIKSVKRSGENKATLTATLRVRRPEGEAGTDLVVLEKGKVSVLGPVEKVRVLMDQKKQEAAIAAERKRIHGERNATLRELMEKHEIPMVKPYVSGWRLRDLSEKEKVQAYRHADIIVRENNEDFILAMIKALGGEDPEAEADAALLAGRVPPATT